MTSSQPVSAVIRAATERDLPALAALIEPFVAQRKLLPRTEQDLRALLPHGFAADWDGRIVGFAALEIYSKKIAEIQCLAVAKEFQGRGIGRRLVQCCVDRARRERVREVMVITSTEGFLKSCGFDYSLPQQRKALFLQTREDRAE
jgi:N-acetylglutamate synthase-like GNAT family acetyltransferase